MRPSQKIQKIQNNLTFLVAAGLQLDWKKEYYRRGISRIYPPDTVVQVIPLIPEDQFLATRHNYGCYLYSCKGISLVQPRLIAIRRQVNSVPSTGKLNYIEAGKNNKYSCSIDILHKTTETNLSKSIFKRKLNRIIDEDSGSNS
jgi:hypothetical protein